jgi:hypothetical protein
MSRVYSRPISVYGVRPLCGNLFYVTSFQSVSMAFRYEVAIIEYW